MRRPADQLLFILKTKGPQDTLSLARALGVSRQAALQTLERLAAQKLVAHDDVRCGVGRPRRVWSLTAASQSRFPDTHAQLTVEMLQAVRDELGETALDRLIARRERASEAIYAEAVAVATDIEGRLRRLVEVRSADGYMAECAPLPDGGWLLVENHCPICAAAAVCQGFCRSELEVFRRVLGPEVGVERVEHMLAGARRCAYRVTATVPRPRSEV